MEEQLIETWNIHNRINLYLLASIPANVLVMSPPSRGRSPYKLFAHIHNVRLMWLKASAPDLLAGAEKLESDAGPPQELSAALTASAAAVETLLRRSFAEGGKVKNFKPNAVAFTGYLISHESHHRGQMTVTLKQLGHALDNKPDSGLWEWGTR